MSDFKVVMVDLHLQPPRPVPAWVEERLAGEGIEFVFHRCESTEELKQYAGDADVVWVFSGRRVVNAGNLHVLRACGAIVRSGLGYDNIPVDEATDKGILVVTTPEIVGPVAEHAIALLLTAIRQIPRHDRNAHAGTWDRGLVPPGHLIEGSTIGLVGFGRAPRQMVGKLAGFGVRFLAYDPYVAADAMVELGVRKVEFDELLSGSDFISLHCSLTDETRHMIGERELRMMPPHAILVNTARGGVVDELSLYRALQEGWITAAALDVMEKEPPDQDNPLLRMENVIITPHMSAYMHRWPTLQFEASVDKILDLAHGRWPKSVVNRDKVKPRWSLS
jgi:D-3-phosphoglycerate dehydrogenase